MFDIIVYCHCFLLLKPLLDPVLHYAHLLSQHQQLQQLNDLATQFLTVHYDVQLRKLCTSRYVVLKRRPVEFASEWDWLYSCNCDESRSQFVAALASHVDKLKDDVVKSPECVHIKASKILLHNSDRERDIFPGDVHHIIETMPEHCYTPCPSDVLIKPVPQRPDRIAVLTKPDSGWGVCSIVYSSSSSPVAYIKCITCSSTHCTHVTSLKLEIESCSDGADDGDSPLAIFCHELSLPPATRNYYEDSVLCDFSIPVYGSSIEGKVRNPPTKLCPSKDGVCECGSPWQDSEKPQPEWLQFRQCDVFIASANDVLLHEVYFRPCSSCDSKKCYDGKDDKLVCLGTYAFGYDILQDYLNHFLTSATPMYHYYKTLMHNYVRKGAEKALDVLHYGKFRRACLDFFRMLDIDYESSFQCPECGPEPEAVVMDGICLGIQRQFMPLQCPGPSSSKPLSGSSFESRNFINNRACRELLKKFCQETLSFENFQTLQSQISLYQPALNGFLQHCYESGCWSACPNEYQAFLFSLAQDSPVCAMVPPKENVLNLITAMSKGYNPKLNPATDLQLLQFESPSIFSLVSIMTEIPDFMFPVFGAFVEKSKAPFLKCEPHDLPLVVNGADSTAFFPCLPKLVERGSYVLDSKRLDTELSFNCEKKPSARGRHKTLVPGLFVLNCPHGVCYGFQVMENHESPDIAFTLLRTRFANPPPLIVYDNACKLHHYVLNRDPVFFWDTRFVVDRLHWRNHSGCSGAYNISSYPQYDRLNSQVAEQHNSALKRLSSMVCYMDLHNFILVLKIFMWFRNSLHVVQNFPHLKIQYKDVFLKLARVYCLKKGNVQ